ncbi:MAG: flagellar biosynthetic protein FliO [Acidobacteria bacterium]|nr:flagellar biosynthetic protein FliO [Acidobacteriota bacterium]
MEMLSSVMSAAAVVLLLLLCLAFLRRKGIAQVRLFRPNGQAGRNLEVLDRLVLTPQHSIHLVRVADNQLLIGLSPSGCSLLQTLPPPSENQPKVEKV